MKDKIVQRFQTLEQGGWLGRGADSFFGEMAGETFPALERLIAALDEAQSVTLEAKQLLEQAEEEAASVFGNGAAGPNGSQPGPQSPSSAGPGGSPSSTLGQPVPVASPGGGSIWDHLRMKGGLWSFDSAKEGGSRRGGKFNPEIKATFGIEESSVWGSPKGDSMAAIGGYAEAGVKLSLEDGVMVGAGGEYYTVKGDWDTALVGDKEFGVTGGVGFKGLSAEGFAGVQFDDKDKRIGATVGVNLVSVEGSVGGNVAGVNVSVAGEVGLKAELGFELGKKGIAIKLPFVSFGLKFGGGVD
jgi:WXG100 family type VII secretion target